MNIAPPDLSRLLLLHTVLRERSVTRAAAALQVTPAAVSNALARLRSSFDDPLLVRSGRGLVLTPRALALAPQLAQLLDAIERLLEGDDFDPSRSTRTFTLAASPGLQISGVPEIAAIFSRRLPNARLRIIGLDQMESGGGLAAGNVDASIAPERSPVGDAHAFALAEEENVLIARKGHPKVRRNITKEQFNTLHHVDTPLFGTTDRSDDFFEPYGLRRHITLSVPDYAAAAAIVAKTDWVWLMARSLAIVFQRYLPLQVVTIPVPIARTRIQLVWHERTHSDAGSSFFRSVIRAAYGDKISAK